MYCNITPSMKLLIYGKGYIGSRIAEYYGKNATFSQVDITDAQAVKEELFQVVPDAVINAAAKIGSRKPKECEEYPDLTWEVNAIAPENIAKTAHTLGVFMIQISTGYLFAGDNNGQGFCEDDEPNFIEGVYIQSKYEAEKRLQNYNNVAILRINKPVDNRPYAPNPNRNQLEKIGSYDKVFDMKAHITFVPHLLKVIDAVLQQKRSEIFHVVSRDEVSNIDMMEAYKKYLDPNKSYMVAEMSEDQKKASPSCLINTDKLDIL